MFNKPAMWGTLRAGPGSPFFFFFFFRMDSRRGRTSPIENWRRPSRIATKIQPPAAARTRNGYPVTEEKQSPPSCPTLPSRPAYLGSRGDYASCTSYVCPYGALDAPTPYSVWPEVPAVDYLIARLIARRSLSSACTSMTLHIPT
jgi:hypothetical protein